MLRIFLSSTFRDLFEERASILQAINKALIDMGMENFVPNGTTSQKIALDELKKAI